MLHNLLSQVSGVEGVGELRDIWHYGLIDNRLCGCGQPFRACDYWNLLIADALGPVGDAEVEALHRCTESFRTRNLLCATPSGRRKAARDASPLLERMEQLYRAVQDRSGCEVVVDSSKNPAYGYLLAQSPALDVRFLQLVRDAPAVAFSLAKRKESEPGRHLPRKKARQASIDWALRHLACELHLGRCGPRRIRVRYEDLVADPLEVVRSILDWLGLPPERASFVHGDLVDMTVRPHTVFGNPVRFRDGPVTLRLDDQWRREMSWRDRAVVNALTGPLRLGYGYGRVRLGRP
jgi:hypothetical protein